MPAAPQKKTFWSVAGKSDVGRVRQENEDAFFCDGESGDFFVVADGVGGLEFGDRASAAAVEGVREFFEKNNAFPLAERPDFRHLYQVLDTKLDALGEELAGGFGIGTTLDVVARGENGILHCAHIGDGGIFLLRGSTFARLTEEHTLAAEELAHGNRDFPEAYTNTLTRVLGVAGNCEPQVFSLATEPGDRILAATDGVTRMLSTEKIEAILGDAAGTPESVVDALIAAANEAGGCDNSTAVVAFVS